MKASLPRNDQLSGSGAHKGVLIPPLWQGLHEDIFCRPLNLLPVRAASGFGNVSLIASPQLAPS